MSDRTYNTGELGQRQIQKNVNDMPYLFTSCPPLYSLPNVLRTWGFVLSVFKMRSSGEITRLAPTCIEERKKCQDHIEAACSGKNLPSSWNGHKNLEMKAVNALLISSALRVFGRKREKEKRGIKEGEMDIKEERDVKKIWNGAVTCLMFPRVLYRTVGGTREDDTHVRGFIHHLLHQRGNKKIQFRVKWTSCFKCPNTELQWFKWRVQALQTAQVKEAFGGLEKRLSQTYR